MSSGAQLRLRGDSRFMLVPLYTYEDTEDETILFFGLSTQMEMIDEDEYVVHTLSDGQQLWQIANYYYGNARLWWVLAEVNGIEFAWDVPASGTIRVPTKETLSRLFGGV